MWAKSGQTRTCSVVRSRWTCQSVDLRGPSSREIATIPPPTYLRPDIEPHLRTKSSGTLACDQQQTPAGAEATTNAQQQNAQVPARTWTCRCPRPPGTPRHCQRSTAYRNSTRPSRSAPRRLFGRILTEFSSKTGRKRMPMR